jgi:hypothetical protein
MQLHLTPMASQFYTLRSYVTLDINRSGVYLDRRMLKGLLHTWVSVTFRKRDAVLSGSYRNDTGCTTTTANPPHNSVPVSVAVSDR